MYAPWLGRVSLQRLLVALFGALVMLGAYGSWGALSVVSVQAEVVKGTRHMLAVMGAISIFTTLFVGNRRWLIASARTWLAAVAAVDFALIAIIGYGDWSYADNQSYYYGAQASEWGFQLVMIGSLGGLLVSAVELALLGHAIHRTRNTPEPKT